MNYVIAFSEGLAPALVGYLAISLIKGRTKSDGQEMAGICFIMFLVFSLMDHIYFDHPFPLALIFGVGGGIGMWIAMLVMKRIQK